MRKRRKVTGQSLETFYEGSTRKPEQNSLSKTFMQTLIFSCIITVASNLIFRIASSDTTATALTFTTYYLLSKREYWDRLCDEIRSKFNSADEITHAAVVHLPFLDAVIHEGKYTLVRES